MAVQVGYGSDQRKSGTKYSYAGRRGGKNVANGGFSNQPTVSYENISQEQWDSIFKKNED